MAGKTAYFIYLVLTALAAPSPAATLAPPDDPRASINYWRPFVLTAEKRGDIADVHATFADLLHAWDDTRVAPDLYVVRSDRGPWAASLADGNILLSEQAIALCKQYGGTQWRDLLAFVLAHELSHQRANDLWHMQFFRLAGNQTPEVRQQLALDLKLDTRTLNDMERREAQADHDGLIAMATAGFNPLAVLSEKDFFTAWVESLWRHSCAKAEADEGLRQACDKAQGRALLAKTKLDTLAVQSVLYQLGVQSFVTGDYATARGYFKAFGRDYPSSNLFVALGLTQLAAAIDMRSTEVLPNFPLLLQAEGLDNARRAQAKRGDAAADRSKQARALLDGAAEDFERAIRVSPKRQIAYLDLVYCYLLQDNVYMATGVLMGKFIPAFGTTPSARLLQALIDLQTGKAVDAQRRLEESIVEEDWRRETIVAPDALRYAIYLNLSTLLTARGDTVARDRLWQSLADVARRDGDGLIFQRALAHLKNLSIANDPVSVVRIMALKIGQKTAKLPPPLHKQALWFEGDPLYLYTYAQERYVVGDRSGTVRHVWQTGGTAGLDRLKVNDDVSRVYHVFGVPTRVMNVGDMDYLAYDAQEIAIRVRAGRVVGWFAYPGVRGN